MIDKETLQEWIKVFPVGARMLWHDQYFKSDWLLGVVTGHKIWSPEHGKLDAGIDFRLDGEPEKVKPGEGHRVHYVARHVLKLA